MGIFVVIIKISTLQHYVVTIVSLVFGAKASRYTAVYLKKNINNFEIDCNVAGYFILGVVCNIKIIIKKFKLSLIVQ